MTYAFKSSNIFIKDKDTFFVGNFSGDTDYDRTSMPSNEIKLNPTNTAANYEFGTNVAIGDGIIVVSNKSSNNRELSIFDYDGNLLNTITAPYGFQKVAVGSGRIVVGCTAETYRSLTYGPGAVYVYTLGGSLVKRIEAPLRAYFSSTYDDAGITGGFGGSVAVGNGKIAVGSNFVYLYDLNGEYIGTLGKDFSWSTDIGSPSGAELNTAASGGYSKDEVSIGNGVIVAGNYNARWYGETGYIDAGAAYLFDFNGRPIRLLGASDKADTAFYGWATAVGCGKIAVSAPYASVGASTYVGQVYLYDLNGENEIILTQPDAASSDYFGWSVAIGSGRVFVGCVGDDDNTSSGSGSVYVYDLHGQYIGKIYASDYGASDQFGYSLATANGKLVVGAVKDDNNGSNSGSAYLFNINVQERHFLDLIDGR